MLTNESRKDMALYLVELGYGKDVIKNYKERFPDEESERLNSEEPLKTLNLEKDYIDQLAAKLKEFGMQEEFVMLEAQKQQLLYDLVDVATQYETHLKVAQETAIANSLGNKVAKNVQGMFHNLSELAKETKAVVLKSLHSLNDWSKEKLEGIQKFGRKSLDNIKESLSKFNIAYNTKMIELNDKKVAALDDIISHSAHSALYRSTLKNAFENLGRAFMQKELKNNIPEMPENVKDFIDKQNRAIQNINQDTAGRCTSILLIQAAIAKDENERVSIIESGLENMLKEYQKPVIVEVSGLGKVEIQTVEVNQKELEEGFEQINKAPVYEIQFTTEVGQELSMKEFAAYANNEVILSIASQIEEGNEKAYRNELDKEAASSIEKEIEKALDGEDLEHELESEKEKIEEDLENNEESELEDIEQDEYDEDYIDFDE